MTGVRGVRFTKMEITPKGKKQTVGGGTGRSGENLLAFAVK